MAKRVVIIGSGIAGLATAYNLREHQPASASGPFEIIILEKKDSPGGNIKTETIDGFMIEGGPDCFLSEKPWAWELCKRLGLQSSLLQTNEVAKKTFVLSKGRLHELPEGVILMVPTKIMPLAFSGLISIPGKLRMALEPFIPRRKDASDESLASFVTRRLGREVLDKIAEPLVAGVHAGDPLTMSVRSSFPKFVQLEQEHGSLIRGMLQRMALMKKTRKPGSPMPAEKLTMFITLKEGLTYLINTLVKRILDAGNTVIRTNVTVTGITKKKDGYEIITDKEPPIKADAVIIAAPAYAAATAINNLDAGLGDMLRTIPYVSTATVSIGFKKKEITQPLDGFGFVIPRTEGRKIMAATWTSVKWAHRAPEDSVLVRCFVGGAKNNDLVGLGDAEMIKMVRNELRDIMGIEAEPVLTRVYRWINSMPQYTIGHDERIAAIEAACAKHPGLFLTGSAYHGIGIADSVRNAEITAKKALHFIANAKG